MKLFSFGCYFFEECQFELFKYSSSGARRSWAAVFGVAAAAAVCLSGCWVTESTSESWKIPTARPCAFA